MFVRNVWADSRFLKSKGMSKRSQRRRERNFLTAAGGIQEEFIYPSPPLNPPWFNVVGSDGEARDYPSGPTLKARGQGRSLSTKAFPTAEKIHASTHDNREKTGGHCAAIFPPSTVKVRDSSCLLCYIHGKRVRAMPVGIYV